VRSQVNAIKSQLLQNPLIQNVAVAGNPIGNNDLGSNGFTFEKSDGSFLPTKKMAQELMIDADYVPALDIKLTKGRNFSGSTNADKYTAALVNETLVKNSVGKMQLAKECDLTSVREKQGSGQWLV
jgi:putative ABC transport system permease protein